MIPWEQRWAARAQVARGPADPGLFLALAPMDGVTDAVFRDLMTGLFGGRSGISLCVSEFVRVTKLPAPAKVLLRHCPELAKGGLTPAGVPVFVQILGGDPLPMAQTARRAAELGAPGIDINFGCPAKTVNNHDGGATLLKHPERLRRIVAAVRDAVPPAIPVSAKIRVGWADDDGLEEIVRAAAAGGAAWITIHARTRAQGYKPPVRWRALARTPGLCAAPIVANGDLYEVEDLTACAAISGCEAFMIGRGSMATPDLFARARGWRERGLVLSEFVDLWRDYYGRLLASGATEGRALCRVKQWLRFAAERSPVIAALFADIKRTQSWAEADARLAGALAAERELDAAPLAGAL
ncbi:MAG: tRNA-dihydrouridine synthase family protein [Nannocystaceae bacterium]